MKRRLLLTNDDGYDAAGLAALASAARRFGEVTIVAPARCHSGLSHRLTTDGDLPLTRPAPGVLAVDGTPADCVRVALHELGPDFDLVLSGINHGGNLGVDVFLSGTVAAAREAVLHGVPAISFSYYRPREHRFRWDRAASLAEELIGRLLERPTGPGAFWNVNFPGLTDDGPAPAVVECSLDLSPLPLVYAKSGETLRYDTDYHDRGRKDGLDVDHCFRGSVTLTRLSPGSG
jgi:5'-nucleotidase